MLRPTTDPSALYRYRDTLTAADVLTVAIHHLDLFTRLAAGPATRDELCAELAIHRRPTEAMLSLALANGLLSRGTDGRLATTPLAEEFLVAGSPFDMRAYYASVADKPGVADFLRVLRSGRPAAWPGEEAEADWHAAMQTEAFAEAFTAAMDCRGRVLAPALAAAVDLAGHEHLLDIGGGSGVYAIGCVEADEALTATILEAPPVDRIAERTVAAAGLTGRIAVETIDMFTGDWPGDADLHLFSNVLHDWDEPECLALLSKSSRSLAPGGRIVVHDMFLDDRRDGPLWAAEYSALLVTVTQGRLYSVGEVTAWLAACGRQLQSVTPTAMGRSVLVAR